MSKSHISTIYENPIDPPYVKKNMRPPCQNPIDPPCHNPMSSQSSARMLWDHHVRISLVHHHVAESHESTICQHFLCLHVRNLYLYVRNRDVYHLSETFVYHLSEILHVTSEIHISVTVRIPCLSCVYVTSQHVYIFIRIHHLH